MDHLPVHVHCSVAECEVIIELILQERAVRLAERKDCIAGKAKVSDIKAAIAAVESRYDAILAEWRKMHA